MINFDEEIKRFKPCLEIEQAEDAIYSNEMNDITDVFQELLKEMKTVDKNSKGD